MPLSHKRDKERKRLVRLEKIKIQPKSEVLQSNSSPLEDIGNSNLSLELDASGEIIPEYW